jgi:hypothetical protein
MSYWLSDLDPPPPRRFPCHDHSQDLVKAFGSYDPLVGIPHVDALRDVPVVLSAVAPERGFSRVVSAYQLKRGAQNVPPEWDGWPQVADALRALGRAHQI